MDNLNENQSNQNGKKEIDWMKVFKVGGIGIGIYGVFILTLIIGAFFFIGHQFSVFNENFNKAGEAFDRGYAQQEKEMNQKTEALFHSIDEQHKEMMKGIQDIQNKSQSDSKQLGTSPVDNKKGM